MKSIKGMKGMQSVKKALALVLCVGMLVSASSGVLAEETPRGNRQESSSYRSSMPSVTEGETGTQSGNSSQKTGVSKQESVYLLLNPDGSVKSQTVSCWLHNDDGLRNVRDISNLSDITNIKSDTEPTVDGKYVAWDTQEPDVYYNGTSHRTPPVSISIRYRLDGKEVDAVELEGKSGHLQMDIHVTNNEKETQTINDSEKTIYTPFAVGLVLNLPTNTFQNVHAGDTTVISDSTNQIVSFLSLPGFKENFDNVLTEDMQEIRVLLQDTFTVEADVTDFTFPDMMAAAATKLSIIQDMELNGTLSDLEEGMNTLKTASHQLTEGTQQLSEALEQYDEKMGEFKESYDAFDQGLLSAVSGASQLRQGASSLDTAIQTLKAKAGDELVAGITGSTSLQQQLVTKMEALQKKLENLNLPSESDMNAMLSQLEGAIEQVSSGSADVAVRVLTRGQKTLQSLLTSSDPVEKAQGQAILQNIQVIQKTAKDQIRTMMSSLDVSQLEGLRKDLEEIAGLSSQLMGNVEKLTSALYDPNDDPTDPKTVVGAVMALAAGADTLKAGSVDLETGLKELGSASGQVKDAASALHSASGQLSEKSGELASGASQFEEEGIGSLGDSDMLTRAKEALAVKDAMEKQAGEYGAYAGAPEGAEISSAFIMKIVGPEQEVTVETNAGSENK
ncbi:MAG: hypothetical protein ACLU62_05870 [Hydrogeniiclostridium sp.]